MHVYGLLTLSIIFTALYSVNAITHGRLTSRSMSPSTALIHVCKKSRHVRGHGYNVRNEYCTGSLISRQVVITAGHCIQGKRGSTLMVNFLDKKKLVLFRTVRKFYIFRQHNGPDIALLLLTKPVTVCDPKRRNSSERFEILRLPLGNPLRSGWSDHDVERAKCVMYGYGRNEKYMKLDYRLRSMPIRLKVRSPELVTDLRRQQKICEGDSGGPVVCTRNGIRYLIGISTSVTSKLTSNKPQLCHLKTMNGKYAVVTGAKFYDIRHGVPRILRFLKVHNQLKNLIDDYAKCF
ncbi:Coagulation factor XI [Toxocara canis]|uniref:Coagulation factor XI n=1 Tax=Toxocara canis TaxID=6265 RepID=A0A0B2W5X2_TOXCA|nr:Coagulation factor XI [Toxocara canis]